MGGYFFVYICGTIDFYVMGCSFEKSLGCSDCDFVRFSECSLFRSARIRHCASGLGSFVYSLGGVSVPTAEVCYSFFPVQGLKDCRVLYSRADYKQLSARLKSMSLYTALRDYGGVPVIYYNLDSIIESCFAYSNGAFEFPRAVYFLEVWESGIDRSKAETFLNSVISKILSVGGRVFLLSSWVLPVRGLGWTEVALSSGKSSGRRKSLRISKKGGESLESTSTSASGGSSSVTSYMKEEGVL